MKMVYLSRAHLGPPPRTHHPVASPSGRQFVWHRLARCALLVFALMSDPILLLFDGVALGHHGDHGVRPSASKYSPSVKRSHSLP